MNAHATFNKNTFHADRRYQFIRMQRAQAGACVSLDGPQSGLRGGRTLGRSLCGVPSATPQWR